MYAWKSANATRKGNLIDFCKINLTAMGLPVAKHNKIDALVHIENQRRRDSIIASIEEGLSILGETSSSGEIYEFKPILGHESRAPKAEELEGRVFNIGTPSYLSEKLDSLGNFEIIWADISDSTDLESIHPEKLLQVLQSSSIITVANPLLRFAVAGWLMQLGIVEGVSTKVFEIADSVPKAGSQNSLPHYILEVINRDNFTVESLRTEVGVRYPVLGLANSLQEGKWTKVDKTIACELTIPCAKTSGILIGLNGKFRVQIGKISTDKQSPLGWLETQVTGEKDRNVEIQTKPLLGGERIKLTLEPINKPEELKSEVFLLSKPSWPFQKLDTYEGVPALLFAPEELLDYSRYKALITRGIIMLKSGDYSRFLRALKTRFPELLKLIGQRFKERFFR